MSTGALAQVAPREEPGAAVRPQGAPGSELINFRVDAGPLSRVFAQVVAQSRASLSSSQDVGDAPVRGVAGRMTLGQALSQVFEGTGWRADTGPGGVIRLVRLDASDAYEVGEIVVTGRRTDFARNDTSLLTRTNTALRQTPATVDSVTEEVIKSQNVFSVAEALRNVPGVLLLNGTTSAVQVGDGETNGVSYTGGLRNSSLAGNAPITDVESVEVLKGVASLLTGAQVAGGTVNYIPKRANGARRRDASVGVGSGEEFLATFDVGGPISSDRGLAFRIAGQVQTADERPNGGNNPYSHAINAMLGYRGGFDADVGLQYYTTKTAFVDIADFNPVTGEFISYGERISDDRYSKVESTRLTYSAEKDLVSREGLTMRLRGRGLLQRATSEAQVQQALGYDFFGMGSLIIGVANRSEQDQASQYVDLYSEFSTGGLEHKLIVAFDMTSGDQITQSALPTLDFVTGPAPALPAFDPSRPKSRTVEDQYGLVLQDQLTWGRFHGLIGLRQSWYKNDTDMPGLGLVTMEEQIFLPSFGLVYDVNSGLSVYGSYRKGFEPLSPSQFPTFDGRSLEPAIQTRQEVGFKSGLFQDRLTINGSYYWYSTENEAVQDLENSGGQYYFENGPGSDGKGYEISVAGSVTPTLKILGGVTHQTRERRDDIPVYALPKVIANVWAIKTFPLSGDRAVDVGFGANYNSGVVAFSTMDGLDYNVDRDFLAFRATLAYRTGDTRVNLSVDNLFDRKNYEPANAINGVPLAPPRVVRLVVSRAF